MCSIDIDSTSTQKREKTTNKFKLKISILSCTGSLCVARHSFLLANRFSRALKGIVSSHRAGGLVNFGHGNATIFSIIPLFAVANMWKCKYLRNVKSIEQNELVFMEQGTRKSHEREKERVSSGFDVTQQCFDRENIFNVYK